MDPLLQSLDSVITSIQRKAPAKPGKPKKSDKDPSQGTTEVEWEIEFEDTGMLYARLFRELGTEIALF